MKQAGFGIFLLGLIMAGWYSARIVPVEEGSGEEGAVTPGDRVTAWAEVSDLWFGIGLALMIGGAVVARRGGKPASSKKDGGPARTAGTLGTARDMLAKMKSALDDLDAGDLPSSGEAIADVLDRILSDEVPELLELRPALIAELGLERFAEMIGHFATMERGAARAWSAITDEAWDEVPQCLDRARDGIGRAVATMTDATA